MNSRPCDQALLHDFLSLLNHFEIFHTCLFLLPVYHDAFGTIEKGVIIDATGTTR